MDADKCQSNGPHADLTFAILGAAMDVMNSIGHGLHEKPYERAIVVEFGLRHMQVVQQPVFPVMYKGVEVGAYIPDLVVADRVIVDTKVIDRITTHEKGQMLNYLRVTGLKVGLILNFKHAKLEWERVVLS